MQFLHKTLHQCAHRLIRPCHRSVAALYRVESGSLDKTVHLCKVVNISKKIRTIMSILNVMNDLENKTMKSWRKL